MDSVSFFHMIEVSPELLSLHLNQKRENHCFGYLFRRGCALCLWRFLLGQLVFGNQGFPCLHTSLETTIERQQHPSLVIIGKACLYMIDTGMMCDLEPTCWLTQTMIALVWGQSERSCDNKAC